jgi:hypothetical protein
MERYSNYKVEIKNIKFSAPDGRVFPKTAIVAFYNNVGEIIFIREYGYIGTRDIYDMIEKKEAINLDNCYVRNFSLTAYRMYVCQEKKTPVEITSFSAKDTFFDSILTIDFSFAEFKEGVVNFDHVEFASGMVTFESAVFSNSGVNFAYAHFREGHSVFSKATFGEGDVTFKNAIFQAGEKDFQYATFGKGVTTFVSCLFGDGDISFVNVNFGDGDTNFKVAQFGHGKKDFRYSKFGLGELIFDRTEFGTGLVDFRTVEIKADKVNFSRAIFGDGDVLFEAIEIPKARVNFKKAIFGNGVKNFELAECEDTKWFFDRTDFGGGSITFLNSKFSELSLQGCHLDHYLDLRVAKCDYVDLSDTIARDIIDLKPFETKVNIHTINFSGMRLIGRIYIDWNKNHVKDLIMRQENADDANRAEQFRVLKQNFNVTGQYTDEDKAYIEFKRFEAQSILKNALKTNKYNSIWAYPSYWFQKLVFDKMGLFATNPMRVILSVVIIYTFFGLLYTIVPSISHADIITSFPDQKLGPVGRGFYLAAVIFFTIGFGDYVPTGFLRIFAGFEGFCGVFLMSYFTVAFVRKILR